MTATRSMMVAGLGLLVVFGLPGRAAGQGTIPQPTLEKLQAMDTNHDNRLSYEEIAQGYYASQPKLLDAFKQRDTNGNGVIDKGELRPIPFGRLDLDGNGSIPPDEFLVASSGKAREFVVRTDANKDGYITLDELNAGVNKAVVNAGASYEEIAAAYYQDPTQRKRLFGMLDADTNGGLQAAEWPDAKSFPAVDANHDGEIDENEFMDAHAALTTALVQALDLNKDGRVSFVEIRRQARMAPANKSR